MGLVHKVLKVPLDGPVPSGHEVAVFGLGCFWVGEMRFWGLRGVQCTASGFADAKGGKSEAEAVRVVFDPSVISYERLLKAFWEGHIPNSGTGFVRSMILTSTPEQARIAAASKATFAAAVAVASPTFAVNTQIAELGRWRLAPASDQQHNAGRAVPRTWEPSGGVEYPLGEAASPSKAKAEDQREERNSDQQTGAGANHEVAHQADAGSGGLATRIKNKLQGSIRGAFRGVVKSH